MSYDVIIIGAGPAGSLCARHLSRQGHSVLLLDKAQFPRPKICGDCLTPLLESLAGRKTPRLFPKAAPLSHLSLPPLTWDRTPHQRSPGSNGTKTLRPFSNPHG
jgi:2-polyprenyl-6-methoxyphenol hydroxylase-like FAD-dependent oxidoreductase